MKTAAVSLFVLLMPALAWAQTETPAQGVARIEIRCLSGNVTVERHEASTVVVRGAAPQFKRQGDVLVLRAKLGPISVKIPQTEVSVRVQSGNVQVTGSHHRIEVHTASGEVVIDAISPEVEVHSLSGGIRLTGQAHTARLEGVSGNIVVQVEGLEQLRVQATNGKLEVAAKMLPRRLDAVTMNGPLTVTGGLPAKADLRARTMSGAVTAVLTSTQAYRLEARTYSGAIRHGDRVVSGNTLTVGSGAARVRLQSFSGGIIVR